MPTDEDWAYFRRCEESLHALYAGKWVLIHKGRLVDAYDRMDTAFAAASGRGPCLIQHLGPLPPPRDLNAEPLQDEAESGPKVYGGRDDG